MNYSEIIGAIQTHAEQFDGFAFVVVGQQQVNTYQTKNDSPLSHVIMLEPPMYLAGYNDAGNYTKTYRVTMAFMGHVEQDTSYIERQVRVNVLDGYATAFIQSINVNEQESENNDLTEFKNVRVYPHHRFSYNSQHMAGVTLEFDMVTIDTFDYCEVLPNVEEAIGIGLMEIGSTFTVS